MTKRTSTDISKDGAAAMSREDRKNEAIMRMIERQEQQRKKREEKKKLAVLNQKNGTTTSKATEGRTKLKTKILQTTANKSMFQRRHENSRVQIVVQFSDNVGASSASNRYFFERKQTIEERQRQQEMEMWERMTHNQQLAQMMAHQRSAHMHPATSQGQAMGYYMNASGGTGGNYEVQDDYSGSSYLSSASKRQRANYEEWGNQNPQMQMQAQQAQMMMNRHESMALSGKNFSGMYDMKMVQRASSNGMFQNSGVPTTCYYPTDQSPCIVNNVLNGMQAPTPSTPFVNPISAEESSASIDIKKPAEEDPVVINVNFTPRKDEQIENESEQQEDAQDILALTKQIQSSLQQRRLQGAPAAPAAYEPQ